MCILLLNINIFIVVVSNIKIVLISLQTHYIVASAMLQKLAMLFHPPLSLVHCHINKFTEYLHYEKS
jgi:hypothetical protein